MAHGLSRTTGMELLEKQMLIIIESLAWNDDRRIDDNISQRITATPCACCWETPQLELANLRLGESK
jgi:hypothetical protein